MAEHALPSVVATLSEGARPNVRLIGLLALGHMIIDVNQGSIPALLPFLRTAHSLSYEAVGTIAANVTSSIIQPLFGYLSDQTARRWLLPAGVLVSGCALGALGIVSSYGLLLPLVIVMGLGIAAYHPEGYKTARPWRATARRPPFPGFHWAATSGWRWDLRS